MGNTLFLFILILLQVDVVRTFRTSKDTPVLWLLTVAGATIGFVLTLVATTQL